MAIDIKSADEIEKMRVAGGLAADVLDMIAPYVKAGISTDELDKICHEYIVNEQDAIPAPLDYHGFPKSICTSINNVVCHGIPSDKLSVASRKSACMSAFKKSNQVLSWVRLVLLLALMLIKTTVQLYMIIVVTVLV